MEDQLTQDVDPEDLPVVGGMNKPLGKGAQKAVLIIVGVICAMGLAVAFAWWNESWIFDPDARTGDPIELTSSEVTFGANMAGRTFTGTITNPGSSSYKDVQAEFDFFDGDDKNLGSSVVKFENLGAGQSTEFTGLLIHESAVRAELNNSTGSTAD